MSDYNLFQIGKRIRRHREKLSMTREEFAESACISPQFLAEIENGKKGMSVKTLYNICKSLDISSDYILFGETKNEFLSESAKQKVKNFSQSHLFYTENIIDIVYDIITETKLSDNNVPDSNSN